MDGGGWVDQLGIKPTQPDLSMNFLLSFATFLLEYAEVAYHAQLYVHSWVGVGGLVDQLGIKPTQPRVSLNFG